MRSLLRRAALSFAAGPLLFWCSCERHHPSELMPAQDGHQNEAAQTERTAPAGSPARRTPPEFFPSPASSPH